MKLLTFLWHGVLWFRQVIFLVYMVIVTIVLAMATIVFGCLKMPLIIRLFPAKLWSILVYWGMFFILWLSFKTRGKENISKQPCVYLSKHQSSWETMIFHGLLPKACFVLKKELLAIPLFGQGLRFVESIPINRSQSLQSFKTVLQNGKNRLKKGLSIVIFPEGTRVAAGSYPKFHRTAMTLAKSTGAKVIPVAHNSGCYWPNKPGLIKPGSITICFGPAISPDKFNNINELNDYCYHWINNKVKALGG